MLDDNLIVKKSYNFALMIIELYKYLSIKKREYVLSKQLLRSGTSIGTNVHESILVQSKKILFQRCLLLIKKH